MPAVTSITLADAQATPVNHTFVPLGPDQNQVWWFEDQSTANPLGYNRISYSLTRPPIGKKGDNSSDRVIRIKVGVHVPTLEVVSNSSMSGIAPAPTVSYVLRSNVEYIVPERATLQNRKDLRKYIALVTAETQLTAMVESLQGIW